MRVLNPNLNNECSTPNLLLIFYFIWTDGLRDLHGLLARSLSRPTSSPRSGTDAEVENTMS